MTLIYCIKKVSPHKDWKTEIVSYHTVTIYDTRLDTLNYTELSNLIQIIVSNKIQLPPNHKIGLDKRYRRQSKYPKTVLSITEQDWKEFIKWRKEYNHKYGYDLYTPLDTLPDNIQPINPIQALLDSTPTSISNEQQYFHDTLRLSFCLTSFIKNGKYKTISFKNAIKLAKALNKHPSVIQAEYAKWRREKYGDKEDLAIY